MRGNSNVFNCNVVYLPGQISQGDTTLPDENTREIPFESIRMTYYYKAHNEGVEKINTDCILIAVHGSFDVVLDDGSNKKTVHLNKASFGVFLKEGIGRRLVRISTDAVLLVIVPELLPLVSVAAINYNNSRTVVETLESIRNQSYNNIELIVIDDCSTENDVEVIQGWLETYERPYKFIKHAVNRGISATYNSGLYAASGKYFTTIDTDDAMLPGRITAQVQILEATDERVAAVYSDAYVMDSNSNAIDGLFIERHRRFKEIPSGNIYGALLQGNYIPVMSVLIKRSVFSDIGPYDEELYDNDFDMWLRISRKYDLIYSNTVSSRYRIRPGSLSFSITPQQWNYTDARIFLKHVGADLPMERIRKIASDVYKSADEKTIPFVFELAIRLKDRYILAAWVLHKLAIPAHTGDEILNRIKASGNLCLSSEGITESSNAFMLFLEEVQPSLTIDFLYRVTSFVYPGMSRENLGIIRQSAFVQKDIYLYTVYLFGVYGLTDEHAKRLLQAIAVSENPGWTRAQLQVAREIDDLRLFRIIAPILPVDLLKSVIFAAYAAGRADLFPAMFKLAARTGDQYFKSVWLFCTFRINVVAGKIISDRINSYMQKKKNGLYIELCMYKDVLEAVVRYNRVRKIKN